MRRFLIDTIDMAPMIEREGREASSSAGSSTTTTNLSKPRRRKRRVTTPGENQGAQTPHCSGSGRTSAHRQFDHGGCFQLRGRAVYPRRHPQALARVIQVFADGAYDRRKIMDDFEEFVIEIVRRIDVDPGFKVLPRRWVVGRIFG